MNILAPVVGRDGCSGYRILNPLRAIEDFSKKEHQTFSMNHGDSGDQLVSLVQGADIIFGRQQHDRMFEYLRNNKDFDTDKKLLVVDFDDDIFNITPFADTYRWGGVEEVEYEGKMLWKDGKDLFDIERNKKSLGQIADMAKKADLITVTTPFLKKRMMEYTGKGEDEIEVLPNCIDHRHWKKWPLAKDNTEIRIGWTGGATHYIDWYTIKEGLKKVFAKYDNLKLVVQGNKWDGIMKKIPHEFHDWIDFDGHPYKAASLNLDIAVIPLKETLFNASKSCIKWYEFSALGVPCVVSDYPPYSTELKHDETALMYKTEDEFVSQLSRLIEDEQLRRKISSNAQKWVKENRDLETITNKYVEVFEKHLKKKLT